MLKSFFWTKENALYAWTMLAWLLFLGWYSVQILVYYNAWNREFYDAIQTLQEERFWDLFWGVDQSQFVNLLSLRINEEITVPSFLEILLIYVPVATYTTWQTQRYTFAWRESNTHYYLKRWEKSSSNMSFPRIFRRSEINWSSP